MHNVNLLCIGIGLDEQVRFVREQRWAAALYDVLVDVDAAQVSAIVFTALVDIARPIFGV